MSLNAGILRSSSGDFDWRLESFTTYSKDYSPVPSLGAYYNELDSSVVGLKLGKLFRSGLYFEPNLQYSQAQAYVKNEFLQLEPNQPVQKTARLSFLLRVPLLQGLGKKNTAVREISASRELDAARLNLLFKVSQAVQDTALAYWNYLAAFTRLEVLKESEERARSILEKTDSLVKADELAAADIQSVAANLADKESSRISGELAVNEARTSLGQAIGMPYGEIPRIPPPSASFPVLDMKLLAKRLSDSAAYCSIAMSNRQDLQALKKQIEGIEAQVVAARDQLSPALNLELSIGADSAISGSGFQRTTQTFEYRQKSPDWSTGIRFIYPLGNNTARGNLEQVLSRFNQGRIQLMESERTIQSAIMLILSSLIKNAQEIEKADLAVRSYEIAVSNEREKYLMGEATMLNLLYIQDRLDAALLGRISALQGAATNLTRLRYEAGRLVRFENGEGKVDVEDLVTVLVP
ncbi:MAG: TolC family protein [Proteobacteria bacterium]|nr:TolC family protein [Pseudomonadota bacterium]